MVMESVAQDILEEDSFIEDIVQKQKLQNSSPSVDTTVRGSSSDASVGLLKQSPAPESMPITARNDCLLPDNQPLPASLKSAGNSGEAALLEDLNVLYSMKMKKDCLAELHSKHEVQYKLLLAESEKQTKALQQCERKRDY
jgi:hypothetical protein